MNEIKDLVEISKYAGERFDLVQAGGGNNSVKFDNGEMIIKASGFLLSDMDKNSGYSRVDTKKIANIVKNANIASESDKRKREALASTLAQEATLDKTNRPSIETLLHSFLYKYTLHTHPVVVNMVVVRSDFREILNLLFENIAIVEYQTPGIELAISLNEELKKFEQLPNIIFLQNHGLIVTSDNKSDIKKLTEYVIDKIEKFLKVNMSRFKLTNEISYLFNSLEESENISYLSSDEYLNRLVSDKKELFFRTPFCPDSLVYCGISCCEIKNLFDIESIEEYKHRYFEMPKVVIFEDKLFFRAINIKKAKEMEEVMKFHIMVLEQNSNINFLELEELAYLGNWEAEKYRQKI